MLCKSKGNNITTMQNIVLHIVTMWESTEHKTMSLNEYGKFRVLLSRKPFTQRLENQTK